MHLDVLFESDFIQDYCGDSVMLRRFRKDDYSEIRTWVNNDRVTGLLVDSDIFAHFHSENETMAFLNGSLHLDYSNFRLVIADMGQRYLGQLEVYNIGQNITSCEFDMIVANPENWRKGIATEATKILASLLKKKFEMRKLFGKVRAENIPGISFLHKAGFKRVCGSDNLNILGYEREL